VQILLTNDDGIYAPGLAAMERALHRLGDVCVVAPATEQSGVGHSITYLTPLLVKDVFIHDEHWGWAVEGSPADCVKIGISELSPRTPDLIVSGINGGLNAGINVLYSGTVAASIEGAFFGITSFAVSLEFGENAPFEEAADVAVDVMEKVLAQKNEQPELYNLNIPIAALKETPPEVRVVPMDMKQHWEKFERRHDPSGRPYYWLTGRPIPREEAGLTDLSAISQGCVTLTPLDFNLTKIHRLQQMEQWDWELPARRERQADDEIGLRLPRGPGVRTAPYQIDTSQIEGT
jgi:5'-nucleotidase